MRKWWVHWGCLLLVLSVLSCQKVISLEIVDVPPSVREGETATLKVIAKTPNGDVVPVNGIVWTCDLAEQAKIDGTSLLALHEGTVTITVTAANATAQHKIEIVSPTIGKWIRTSEPYKGMVVELKKAGDELVGMISVPPPADEDAIGAAMKELHYSRISAKNLVTCEEQLWSPGLRKLKDLKRIDTTTWNGKNLKMSPIVRGKQCLEGRDSGSYEDFEIKLVDPNHLEMNSLTSSRKWSSSNQKWERLTKESVQMPIVNQTAVK